MQWPANADACLRRALLLRGQLMAPKSIDLEDREATYAWAKRCSAWPRCRSRKWASVWDAKAYRSRPRCVRCGRLWFGAYVHGEGLGGVSVRSGESEVQREYATYVAWFQRLTPWQRWVWGLYVVGYQGGHRPLADECRRRWPAAPFAWNKDRVWRLVREARECVEERLAAARLEWEATG